MKIYKYKDSKNVIGPAVLRLRTERGLTQKEVAELMQLHGVTANSLVILRIEKGLLFVMDFEVRALAEVFQVEIKDLYPQ